MKHTLMLFALLVLCTSAQAQDFFSAKTKACIVEELKPHSASVRGYPVEYISVTASDSGYAYYSILLNGERPDVEGDRFFFEVNVSIIGWDFSHATFYSYPGDLHPIVIDLSKCTN
jgi:hypothetical protein